MQDHGRAGVQVGHYQLSYFNAAGRQQGLVALTAVCYPVVGGADFDAGATTGTHPELAFKLYCPGNPRSPCVPQHLLRCVLADVCACLHASHHIDDVSETVGSSLHCNVLRTGGR